MLGKHRIKSWSSTQASISLSSGEAEFYGVVKASGIALGYQALLSDLGSSLPVRVWTDSSATMGICGRQGLGRLRHVDTQCLWIQQRVRDGSLELRKVKGEQNPADLFTKHLSSSSRIRDLLNLLGCDYVAGRSALAPKLREGAGAQKGELLQAASSPSFEGIQWCGKVFPVVTVEGVKTPDAFEHDSSLLPHEHADLESVFPGAVAVEQLMDKDPVGEEALERCGEELGLRARPRTSGE